MSAPSWHDRLLACSQFAKRKIFALSEQQTQGFKLHWQCCLFMLSDADQGARQWAQYLPLHTEYWRPSLLPPALSSAGYHVRVTCKPQMHRRPMTIIYLPQLRVASTSCYAFLQNCLFVLVSLANYLFTKRIVHPILDADHAQSLSCRLSLLCIVLLVQLPCTHP